MATDPKEARELVHQRIHPCPNCGGALLVKIESDSFGLKHFQALVDSGARVAIVSAEDAEEEIRRDTTQVMKPTVVRTDE